VLPVKDAGAAEDSRDAIGEPDRSVAVKDHLGHHELGLSRHGNGESGRRPVQLLPLRCVLALDDENRKAVISNTTSSRAS